MQLHEKKCIFIFHGSFCSPRFMEPYFFLGVDNSSLVNCLPKRFLLSELLKFWDKKHTSSLVWYVVCIENLYFSICRCVCSNLWDFQFLVSSSFLFPRFLVAVIDKILLICFDTWPFTQPNFFSTEPSLAVFLRWHFYVAVTLLLFYSKF